MTVDTPTQNIMDILPDVLNDVVKNKEKQREIEEILATSFNIPRGTFHELLANNERFVHLNEEERIVLTVVLYDTTNDDRIDPKKFYSQRELKAASKYKHEDEIISLPYTIEGVLRVTDEDYLTAMSYQEIAKLWNSKILTYNFQTQRLSKKKVNKKGKITEKMDIKTKSVQNIKRLMKEGKYDPSTIVINILVDGNSSIDYEDGALTINENSTCNLIDGAHRCYAILELLEEDPSFEGYMNVDIKNFPIEKAQKLLSVTNTVNKFDKTLTEYYGGEKLGQLITKELMKMPELHNRIEIKTALNKGITITNFSIVSKAIEDIFEPQDNKDKYDITDVLKRFFEYFMATYQDDLIKNRETNLKQSWLPHHNLFVAHIAIAKKLYDRFGKEFPVNEIVRIYNSINFSKEDSEINEILSGQGKVNSNRVKAQIREFFEKKADELLA